jgi:hypothetical protein
MAPARVLARRLGLAGLLRALPVIATFDRRGLRPRGRTRLLLAAATLALLRGPLARSGAIGRRALLAAPGVVATLLVTASVVATLLVTAGVAARGVLARSARRRRSASGG